MSDFKSAYPDNLDDPRKRVYYSHGLVLGVDEFRQEELYLLENDRRHSRGLHGYGTVCGLRLDTREVAGQLEIIVGPGLALDPQGREVRVPEGQCARLDDWLLRHHDELVTWLGSPPDASPAQLALYLVLCYAECATDQVPVPSGPCQSLDRTMAPSRIADDFRLELRTDLSLPEQVEEQAVRDLVSLLDAIPVLDAPGGMSEDEMIELVRSMLPGASPPVVSPPAPAGHMHPSDAAELRRAAFRVWVTDVRPELLAGGRNCAAGPPVEDCILLARVEFPVMETDAGLRVSGPVYFDQSQRPFLLHTRLLQEEILQRTSAVIEGSGSEPHTHDEYLLVDGSRPVTSDLSIGGHRITDVAEAIVPTDALTLGHAERDFVRGLGSPYGVIAAGRFDSEGNRKGPVYNKLKAAPIRNRAGFFTLSFPGYENPDTGPSKHNYVVKGSGEGVDATLHVVAFGNNGIQVRVTGEVGPMPRTRPGFMVEIGVFGKF